MSWRAPGREYLLQLFGCNQRPGVMGQFVCDQNEAEIIAKTIANRLNHPHLSMKQDVHKPFQKHAIVVKQIHRVLDADGTHCSMEKRTEAHKYADASAGGGSQIAFEGVQLVGQRQRRRQMVEISPGFDQPASKRRRRHLTRQMALSP